MFYLDYLFTPTLEQDNELNTSSWRLNSYSCFHFNLDNLILSHY